MRREIRMPSILPSMTDAKVARWHVSEGQSVAEGDLLLEVATPTATFDIEADGEGRVERILVPAGTEGVKVDTPIAILFGDTQHQSRPLAFAALEQISQRERAAAHAEKTAQSYAEALRDALAAEMRADPSVFLIGLNAARNRGTSKVMEGLIDEFGPARVITVAAFDEAMIGMALGAAFAGLRPVVEVPHWGSALETLSPYLTSAVQAAALSGRRLAAPIVFRGPNGYVPGMTGNASRCAAASLAHRPGLKVAQPATAASAKALLKAAIRDPGPVALLEDARLYRARDAGDPAADGASGLGTARIARNGRDLTLTAAGHALVLALEAAAQLARDGIEAEVIDLMSLRPLDHDTIVASVRRTGRLATVEEGWGEYGIGAEIAASVAVHAFGHLKKPPARIAGSGVPMPYAPELQTLALPRTDAIIRAARNLVRDG